MERNSSGGVSFVHQVSLLQSAMRFARETYVKGRAQISFCVVLVEWDSFCPSVLLHYVTPLPLILGVQIVKHGRVGYMSKSQVLLGNNLQVA